MIKFYGNRFSPPCNKVEMCLNLLGLEYEFIPVDLLSGAQRKPEFLEINFFGKAPAIIDGDFKLAESNAIMKYLSRKAKSDLYPEDIKQQAEVDMWLDFISQHLIMQGYMKIMFNKMIAPRIGVEVDEKSIKEGYENLSKYFPLIEGKLTKTKFLVGDKITIADVALLSTIDPSEMIQVDLKPYPKLLALRNSLTSQNFYQKVHKFYGEAMLSRN